eukprot:s1048_g27.t1
MVKAVEWLSQHGPTALARERESSHVNKAPAKKQAPAVVQPAVESKADRIEQARRERLSAKFTEKWDLCYAFIKHGSCKDKNCQWRHELPPKKEEAKEVKETKVETKAKPVPPVKRERTNGSEREGRIAWFWKAGSQEVHPLAMTAVGQGRAACLP